MNKIWLAIPAAALALTARASGASASAEQQWQHGQDRRFYNQVASVLSSIDSDGFGSLTSSTIGYELLTAAAEPSAFPPPADGPAYKTAMSDLARAGDLVASFATNGNSSDLTQAQAKLQAADSAAQGAPWASPVSREGLFT